MTGSTNSESPWAGEVGEQLLPDTCQRFFEQHVHHGPLRFFRPGARGEGLVVNAELAVGAGAAPGDLPEVLQLDQATDLVRATGRSSI